MNLSEVESNIKTEFDKLRDELEKLFGTHREVTAHIDAAESAVIEHATSMPAQGEDESAKPSGGNPPPLPVESYGKPSTES